MQINPYVLYYESEKGELITENKCYNAIDVGKASIGSTSEYFSYCVKLKVLIDFIAIVKKHKLLHTHMCDVAFSSVLHHITKVWTCEASSIDRASKTYGISYYNKNYPRRFFNDLAEKFNISNWE